MAVYAIKGGGNTGPIVWWANPRDANANQSGFEVEVIDTPAAGAYDFDLKP